MKWYVFALCVFLVACASERTEKKHLPIDKMKLVMWDLIKAGEWEFQIVARDSMMRKKKEDIRLYAQVFSIHGLTREQFFESYKYYETHPVDYKILVDSLEAYATREKNMPVDSKGRPL